MGVDDLRIVVRDVVDGVATVAVSGELDGATCGYLSMALSAFAELPEVAHVIVDLSDLEFMDSSGLSTIVHARRLLDQQTGATLSLIGAGGGVRRVLEITGMGRYLRSDIVTALAG